MYLEKEIFFNNVFQFSLIEIIHFFGTHCVIIHSQTRESQKRKFKDL